MATVRDLLTGALKSLTVLGEGDTATAQQITDALDVFNELVDHWNTKVLTLHQVKETSFTLTGAASYTIGPGGTINTTRPESIDRAWYRRDSIDYPIAILDAAQWAGIEEKSLSSGWPTDIYYETDSPLGKIWTYPLSNAGSIYLQTHELLTEATADTVVSLPSGYRKALRYNLAIDLAPQFGVEPSQAVVKAARESLADVKSRNNRNRKPSACIEVAENYGRNNIYSDGE